MLGIVTEGARERGKWASEALSRVGRDLGLDVRSEVAVPSGRVDLVWFWEPPSHIASSVEPLPLVAFEIESSWRTRKHIKGDFMNLIELQPALAVVVLLGSGDRVDSLRRYTEDLASRTPGRVAVWSDETVARLIDGKSSPSEVVATARVGTTAHTGRLRASARHTGKYHALWEWLVPQEGSELQLRFEQIESVLGFALPPSSRRHVQHWYSYEGSAVVRAIQDAGWKVGGVDLKHERVSLHRAWLPSSTSG